MARPDGRAPDQLRPVTLTRDFLLHHVERPKTRAAILDAVSLLADFPEAYPVARSRRYGGLRAMAAVRPFVVLYRVEDAFVSILAILDGRRGVAR
jgi:plasmid stabilization system protein ParE